MSPLRGDVEVRYCRVLVAVHEEGGVAAAAEALGVSQSTASEALLALERIVGVSLLQRLPGRGGRLSLAGEAMLPHARHLIAASEAALAAMTSGDGVVRLGVVESVSSYLLPGPLSEVRRLWPQLEVRVTVGLCDELRRRTSRLDLDAAITIEGVRSSARRWAASRTLSPARLVLVVSPESDWVHEIVDREALRSRPILLADSTGAFNALMREWFGLRSRCARLESAGSIDGVKRGVRSPGAIGLLPSYACAAELSNGTLRALRIRQALPDIALYVTTPGAAPPSPVLDVMTKQICRQLEVGAAT